MGDDGKPGGGDLQLSEQPVDAPLPALLAILEGLPDAVVAAARDGRIAFAALLKNADCAL
jgi:hypothetical protein